MPEQLSHGVQHGLAFGRPAEAKLVNGLRQSGDAVISLVAERDSRAIGHLLFSKLKAPMRALGLAPVAVHPSFQKQGVGLALIREGLARAKEDGWMCVFVLGDPAYYGRFGFRVESARGYSSPYSGDHFMAVRVSPLDSSAPGVKNNHTVPYGTDPLIASSLAMNCQATIISSLRDKNPPATDGQRLTAKSFVHGVAGACGVPGVILWATAATRRALPTF